MTGKLPNGCDNSIDADIDPGRTIKVVPKQNRQMLTEKQSVDYYSRWQLGHAQCRNLARSLALAIVVQRSR
jgi:hypothetical protein